MALPNYVVQRNVRGGPKQENVVVLDSTNSRIVYLVWDDLDTFARDAYDTNISGEGDKITALKNYRYRNQSFYLYLQDSIITVSTGLNGLVENNVGNVLERSYNRNYDSLRVGKYSGNYELATYQTTNVFSYLSTLGPSRYRDVIETTGSGTIVESEGKIRLSTGTSSASFTKLQTVEKGRYIPGKSAEAGVAVWVESALTGDQSVTIELGDGKNSARFIIEANDVKIQVIRDDVIQESVSHPDWNINPANGQVYDPSDQPFNYDPNSKGYIYSFLFNWYGIGKIIFSVEEALSSYQEPLSSIPVHEYFPNEYDGNSFLDPNLPITVIADNGSTTSDVIVDVGGRRYDILGEFKPEFRKTSVYQTLSTFTDARRVAFGVRRKADFPAVGRENTVPVYLRQIETVLTGGSGVIRVLTVPRGTLTGTWGDLPERSDQSETALELNTTVNDVTLADFFELEGPILVTGGQANNTLISDEKGLRVPVINDEELVIELDMDATVSGPLKVAFSEEF